MAKMTINGFDDVEKLFTALYGKKGELSVAIKAVEAAAPYLVDSAKHAVEIAAYKGYATGKLARSFEATKPKTNKYGSYTVVRPVGRDPDGVDFSDRGIYLEYGTYIRGEEKNEPQPWRQRAINSAKAKCEKIMQEEVEKEVDEAMGGMK